MFGADGETSIDAYTAFVKEALAGFEAAEGAGGMRLRT